MAGVRFIGRLVVVYFVDWLVILGTIGFAGSMSLWAHPAARFFSLSDPSISYPLQRHTKIPSPLLISVSIFIPVVLVVLLCVAMPTPFTEKGWRRKLYAANKALLGLLLSVAIAMLLTNSLKNLLGKPRPDMLSRCDPDIARTDARVRSSLVSWEVCQNSRGSVGFDDLRDGFRSFPSGHASMSFAGLTYFSIFLACFVFSTTPPFFSRTLKPLGDGGSIASTEPPTATTEPVNGLNFPQMLEFMILAVPICIAIYISATRWTDYRHHGPDIIAGSLLGIFAALVGWGWYGVFCCRRRIIRSPGGKVVAVDIDVDGGESGEGVSGSSSQGRSSRSKSGRDNTESVMI